MLDNKTEEEKPGATSATELSEAAARPSWKKVAFLAIGAGILLAVIYASPLRTYLSHWQQASQDIRNFGPWAPLVLTVSVAVLVAVGFPRLFFCFIAGMALGFWSGLLWAQIGTLVGNYALFIAARAGGREYMERLLTRRAHLHTSIQQRGALGVILARQIPLPGLVINLTCALLPIRHVDFIVGTLIGQLPQAIPCTLIGAGALQPSFRKSIVLIGVAVIVAVLGWIGLRYVLQRANSKTPKS